MLEFEKIVKNVFRLCVPFENIYTSVFLIKLEGKTILIDGANSPQLVNEYIVPALNKIGRGPDVIISSHGHGDHSGGIMELAKIFTFAKIGMMRSNPLFDKIKDRCIELVDSEIVFGDIKILNLKGHSDDSLAVYDMRTKTLISNDCLQLAGVGRYGTAVTDAQAYLNSLKRIEEIGVQNIITSHDYVPLGYKAIGEEAVNKYIKKCEQIITKIKDYISISSSENMEEIAQNYNNDNQGLPPISQSTIESIKKLLDKNAQ